MNSGLYSMAGLVGRRRSGRGGFGAAVAAMALARTTWDGARIPANYPPDEPEESTTHLRFLAQAKAEAEAKRFRKAQRRAHA